MIKWLAFGVALAAWPWWRDLATAPRWGLLAIATPALLFTVRLHRNPGSLIGLALCAYAALTISWATSAPEAWNGLAILVILYMVFLLGTAATDLSRAYLGFALGISVSSVLAVGQAWGWSPIPQGIAPAGTFVNKNFLAESGVLALAAMVWQRRWWLCGALAPSVVVTTSREAAVALVAMALATWQPKRLWLIVIVAAPLALASAYAFRVADTSERTTIWTNSLSALTPLGHGIGQFYINYPAFATDTIAKRPDHAHNDLLEIAFELGFPGTILAVAFAVWTFRRACALERVLLLGIAAEASFAFPLHLPATGYLAALVAGRCWATAGAIRSAHAWRPRIIPGGPGPAQPGHSSHGG